MSILPTTFQPQQQSLLIFTQTEQIDQVLQTSQFEKLQQQQQIQLQQQQPNLKMTTQPNSLVTRTRTSSSSFFNSSLFETNYVNTYNPADTLDLIFEEFNDNPYTSSASSSSPSISMVPSITEEVLLSQTENKENTFSHPSFYETNTEVKNFDLLQELNIINSSVPSIISTYSPPHSRDTSYSPSPSPSSSSDLSYSSASAATSSFLKGTLSKPRVKKNRGTPPKPVNATKEEMEKYLDIRNKNNLAASTSRKKKKEKEEENIKKLEFLKKENEQLRILLEQCKQEATSLNEELQNLIKNFKKG